MLGQRIGSGYPLGTGTGTTNRDKIGASFRALRSELQASGEAVNAPPSPGLLCPAAGKEMAKSAIFSHRAAFQNSKTFLRLNCIRIRFMIELATSPTERGSAFVHAFGFQNGQR